MSKCLGEDVIIDIMKRLPAKSVACAACVCRSWRNHAANILSTPKLTSALSQNPQLEAAMDEIMEKILEKPIRPDFAIAFAGQKFSLSRISILLKKNLGSKIPTIACYAPGIIGPDAITKEQKEVKWPQPVFETSKTARRRIIAEQHGLVVIIGHFPGLHIKAFALRNSFVKGEVDSFVASLVNYATSLSNDRHPLAMILLADPRADIRHMLESLDEGLCGNTVMVGGLAAEHEGACLYYNNQENSKIIDEYQSSNTCIEASTSTRNWKGSKLPRQGSASYDAVTLVFAKGKNGFRGTLSTDCGSCYFSPAVSAGLAAAGPIYKAVSVKISKDAVSKETSTWLTCRKEGVLAELDGQSVLDDLDNEVGGDILSGGLYIGVLKRSKRFMSLGKGKAAIPFRIHEVHDADEEYLFVEGEGIKTGDVFRFYRTDPETAKSSSKLALEHVCEQLRSPFQKGVLPATTVEIMACTLKQHYSKVFGGLLFACNGRGQSFFGDPNVDSSAFSRKYSDVPIAGMFCLGELGPPAVHSWEATEGGDTTSQLNFYSSIFMVFSHISDSEK